MATKDTTSFASSGFAAPTLKLPALVLEPFPQEKKKKIIISFALRDHHSFVNLSVTKTAILTKL